MGSGFYMKALIAVRKKLMGLLKASEAFAFPGSTLKSDIRRKMLIWKN
jgi:hypothetical protein